ncbi:hypothetical protein CORC01_08800 [Colletotrichum orchidophilum]|uniref:Uncharacterized protein n=1 Tax=Colletotrichum orchidophilum TaxID=1209926 RepID=A0A1G4B3E3_9PEZI|nr:uncharacterized protein CORC01_08800 [Colletotrichum orchidophilum]OHE95948.1 hypothetical protein CORC01_08800 [Colletotrichum orchidophilum]
MSCPSSGLAHSWLERSFTPSGKDAQGLSCELKKCRHRTASSFVVALVSGSWRWIAWPMPRRQRKISIENDQKVAQVALCRASFDLATVSPATNGGAPAPAGALVKLPTELSQSDVRKT